MNYTSELFSIADTLSKIFKELDSSELDNVIRVAEEVGKSWCGSCLGYHSRIYYKDLAPVPPRARFSKEWGFMNAWPIRATVGNWVEYDFDDIVKTIKENTGNLDFNVFEKLATHANESFENAQSHILSILSRFFEQCRNDKYIEDLIESIKKQKVFTASNFAEQLTPSGQQKSRDKKAIQAGIHIPPHISVIAKASSLRSCLHACDKLGKYARHAASHIENLEKKQKREEKIGPNVFIGHGRSKIWEDLKDFIQARLHLPWDAFNRAPVAGVTNIARLSQKLDKAAIAFLIMTVEDEQADGKSHARQNVIHEAGLFQGRLGFERAIILLEDGCEAFSNVQGLEQIRFPKGNVSAVFENIRSVLEREGLVDEK